jgi:hypothetical protein
MGKQVHTRCRRWRHVFSIEYLYGIESGTRRPGRRCLSISVSLPALASESLRPDRCARIVAPGSLRPDRCARPSPLRVSADGFGAANPLPLVWPEMARGRQRATEPGAETRSRPAVGSVRQAEAAVLRAPVLRFQRRSVERWGNPKGPRGTSRDPTGPSADFARYVPDATLHPRLLRPHVAACAPRRSFPRHGTSFVITRSMVPSAWHLVRVYPVDGSLGFGPSLRTPGPSFPWDRPSLACA